LVTGDHLETAKYVATKAGIISEEELVTEGYALTGEEFRNAIGPYEKDYD
jgi:magnesium-transporting ATPase (P-type)